MKSATRLLLNKTYQEIWHRGEAYADSQKVVIETHDEKEIYAYVQGTELYKIHIRFYGSGTSLKCDCPYFAKNKTVCKHIVAVAIIWDERRGVPRPADHEVEYGTIQPRALSRRDVEHLFENPLEADLEELRILSEETALGGYIRPHSRLPIMPKMITDENRPLERKELKKCYSEMVKWTRRKAYDLYFCSGEMMAAFCEVLRIVKSRLAATHPLVAADILLDALKFDKTLVMELIDDSQGIHEFSWAHLRDIYEYLLECPVADADKEKFDEILCEFEDHSEEF
jgi:hypothetical protein